MGCHACLRSVPFSLVLSSLNGVVPSLLRGREQELCPHPANLWPQAAREQPGGERVPLGPSWLLAEGSRRAPGGWAGAHQLCTLVGFILVLKQGRSWLRVIPGFSGACGAQPREKLHLGDGAKINLQNVFICREEPNLSWQQEGSAGTQNPFQRWDGSRLGSKPPPFPAEDPPCTNHPKAQPALVSLGRTCAAVARPSDRLDGRTRISSDKMISL